MSHAETTHQTPPDPPAARATGLPRRALAAALTMVAAAALAVAAAFGVVALLEATPDQPNTPLITYENAGQER
ncbi:hypothetical protein CTU88_05010 [Streptomyces sp. JV178]|jgi:hypothetical protein|uniref:hypothetical protein n=1 Tax=unclassified Streptomyces TaxID=2593676 RepID=UPI000C1B1C49|nr:hypothetical protein [Streptomyces sp. JV178]PIM73164.1 hypothetical protein CTU88_05010 [Streptomyces sp. JV178]